MRQGRRWLLGVLAVLMVAGTALYLFGRGLAVDLLMRELGKRGVVTESFALGGVSLHGIEFREVKLLKPVALTLPNLALGIFPSALLHGRWAEVVSSVTVESVALELRQADDGWYLNDAPLPSIGPEPKPSETVEPTNIGALPLFPDMEIKKGHLHVVMPGVEASAPFSLSSHRRNQAQQIRLTIEPLHAQYGALPLDIRTIRLQVEAPLDGSKLPAGTLDIQSLSLRQNERTLEIPAAAIQLRWLEWNALPLRAKLDVPRVNLTGLPPELSTLAATADCRVESTAYDCRNITVQTPTAKIRMSGKAAAPFALPNLMRWSANGQATDVLGGTLRFTAQPVKTGFTPAKLNLQAMKLGLQPVLSLLAEGRVNAEGTLSGAIPLIWYGGEEVAFGQGNLSSDGPGVLHLSPELLHMENAQIAVVTRILADFRYEKVEIALQGSGRNGLKARLSLMGHNPAEWSGRPVKLNVNLGGDLLSLLKQSILPMSDPRQWLDNPPASSPRSH